MATVTVEAVQAAQQKLWTLYDDFAKVWCPLGLSASVMIGGRLSSSWGSFTTRN